MSWWRRLVAKRRGAVTQPSDAQDGPGGEGTDRAVDRNDPAVALAMKVLAAEDTGADDALIDRALEIAKADYDAAPDAEKPEKMRRVAQLSMRKALAKAQRDKFHR